MPKYVQFFFYITCLHLYKFLYFSKRSMPLKNTNKMALLSSSFFSLLMVKLGMSIDKINDHFENGTKLGR